MPIKVFFSWQTDTETRGGRNLIERALERAAARIGADTEVEEAARDVEIDRDTKDVPGSPPIVDTIFRKIDKAAVFVPDLTFVGTRTDSRPTPNPNVLVEYGWALKSLTHSRIVPVMNTAYGEPTSDAMPFDMRHFRNPITYDCPAALDDASRRKVREQLSNQVESAIRAVLGSEEFKSSLPKPPEPTRFVEKQAADGHGRFRAVGEPLGLLRDFMGPPKQVLLADGPVCWFRMIPTTDPGQRWSVPDLEKFMSAPLMSPLSYGWKGLDSVHGPDGYGIYSILGEDRTRAAAVLYAFVTGEVWSIDTHWLMQREDEQRIVPAYAEKDFRRALVSYGGFLERLGIPTPYRWVAGMEDLKGRHLYMPCAQNYVRFRQAHDGEGLVDDVFEEGHYSPGQPPGLTLKPFFEKLYQSCGVSRQDWQDK